MQDLIHDMIRAVQLLAFTSGFSQLEEHVSFDPGSADFVEFPSLALLRSARAVKTCLDWLRFQGLGPVCEFRPRNRQRVTGKATGSPPGRTSLGPHMPSIGQKDPTEALSPMCSTCPRCKGSLSDKKRRYGAGFSI